MTQEPGGSNSAEDETGASAVRKPLDFTAWPGQILSPSLEAILDQIGWATVKDLAPWFAMDHAMVLTPGADGRVPDIPNARAVIKRFSKLAADIERVIAGLNSLSPELSDQLNSQCRYIEPQVGSASSEFDEEEVYELDVEGIFDPTPDYVQAAKDALERLQVGLTAQSKLHRDLEEVSQGRRRNEWAYQIASSIAEIYVVSTGKEPTYGRDAYTGEINGEYARVVEKVYRELGLKVGDPIDPCKVACKKILENPYGMLALLGRRDAAESGRDCEKTHLEVWGRWTWK